MFEEIFGYGEIYMPLLPLIVFFIIKKNIPRKEYPLAWFAFTNFVVFTTAEIMAYSGNNLIVYHFYYAYELIFITWYFSKNLFKKFSPVFYIISGAFVLFWLINIITWEPFNTFPSTSGVIEKAVIIFLCMYLLLQLAKSERIMYFQRLPEFWIVSGFLIASIIEIFAIGSYKYFDQIINDPSGVTAWLIDIAGIFFKFIFITIAFLCYNRKTTSFSSSL